MSTNSRKAHGQRVPSLRLESRELLSLEGPMYLGYPNLIRVPILQWNNPTRHWGNKKCTQRIGKMLIPQFLPQFAHKVSCVWWSKSGECTTQLLTTCHINCDKNCDRSITRTRAIRNVYISHRQNLFT